MARPLNPNPGGGLLGAILGGALAGPWGAAAGGVIGATAGGEKLPLEEALRTSLTDPRFALNLIRLERRSKFSVGLLVRQASGRFLVFQAQIPVQLSLTAEQLEDALYDAAMRVIVEWRHRQRTSA